MLLMSEMTYASVDHDDATFVSCIDHFLVAHGAARMDYASCAGIDYDVQSIAEREEGI